MLKKTLRKIIGKFRVFYYKWILGNCRHFCRFCKYTTDCVNEIDYLANRSGKF